MEVKRPLPQVPPPVWSDFKDLQEPLIKAVWSLLGEYEGWITTAAKSADPHTLTPFDPKPLLVLTEDADAQEEVFYKAVPVGGKLRLFGSAHTKVIPAEPKAEHEHLLATLPPEELLSERPTTYRRWWNTSWHTVEEGGQRQAGDWTPNDDRRLRALVQQHRVQRLIRGQFIGALLALPESAAIAADVPVAQLVIDKFFHLQAKCHHVEAFERLAGGLN